jgi:hypothetical protein
MKYYVAFLATLNLISLVNSKYRSDEAIRLGIVEPTVGICDTYIGES